jgi:AcrR family transcriptional regulator
MSDPALLERTGRTHRRERRKHERPGELLEAALELFVDKGYAATRIEEVAARAGVSKSTVFLYFPSKLELFKEVVRCNISNQLEQWAGHFGQFEGSSAEMLRLTMLLWWERIGSTPASGISKLMMSEGRNFPEMADFFHQAVIQPGQQILRQVVQRGIERGEFRAVSVDHAVQGVISVMVFLALSRHCAPLSLHEFMNIEPVSYLDEQARLIARGLACVPAPHDLAGGGLA